MRKIKTCVIGLLAMLLMLAVMGSCSKKEAAEKTAITCPEDLKGHTAGVLEGSVQDLSCSKIEGATIKRFKTVTDLFLALETDVCEYAVIDKVSSIGMGLQAKGITEAFKVAGGDVGMGFRKDGRDLQSQCNAFIQEIKASGLLKEMEDRWCRDDLSSIEMPDLGPEPTGKPIKIGTDIFPPFSFLKDGKQVGFEMEMMERLARKLNRPVEYSVMDFGALIPALQSGKVDMITACVIITDERKKQVLFSDSYYEAFTSFFRKAGKASKKAGDVARCKEDLKGHSLCVLEGSVQDLFYSKTEGINIQRLKSVSDLLLSVESGICEYTATDNASFLGIDLDAKGIMEAYKETEVSGGVGAGFRKEDKELQGAFNAYLKEITENGQLDEIKERWLTKSIDSLEVIDFGPKPTGKPIRIGTIENPPFDFQKEGKEMGYEAELMERFSRKINRPIEYSVMDFNALISSLISKKVDIIASCINITEERRKQVLFSDSYFDQYTICFKKKDANAKPRCIEDLRGHKLAVMTGSMTDVVYSQAEGVEIMRLNSAPEVLTACELGQAEFCAMDSIHFIGSHADERGAEYCFTDTIGGNVGIAFNKEDQALCESYNNWLHKAQADGTMQEIIDRWTKGDVANAEIPDLGEAPEGEPLKIGVTTDFPFIFIKNEKWTGLEIEMAERWGRSIGRPIQIELLNFSSLLASLETKKIDAACAFMYITTERQKQALFSEPYYSSHSVIFHHITAEESKASLFSWAGIKESFNNNIIKEDRWKLLLDGLWETLIISLGAILFGTLLGGVICTMSMSRRKWLSMTAKGLVDLIRGIPILVFLMILFYIVFASSSITARWVAIIAFSINFGAYVSEMFRTGIESIDRGQTEAGLALGFSKLSTFFHFIIPQALKRIIPVYKGEAVSLIKSTSVVGYIAIQDLTKVSDIIRSRTFDAFFPLIIISIIYLLLAWLLGKALDRLNK